MIKHCSFCVQGKNGSDKKPNLWLFSDVWMHVCAYMSICI